MRKHLTVLLLALGMIANLSWAGSTDPLAIMKKKGCFACHDLEKQKSGPPFKVVAKEYKGKSGAVDTLVQSITVGSMGKWQKLGEKYGVKVNMMYMPRQSVSKEEAKKIVEYILSLE
ncbi:c-type cytochrome [Persephonella sp.]